MKLLAADFDNTIFNGDDYKKNIRFINNFIDDGNLFVIITGRHIEMLLKDIESTGLKYNYLICNDGGIIFDRDLNILYQNDIPKHVVVGIASLYEQSNCLDDWYIDTGVEVNKDKNSTANGLIGRFNNRDGASKLLDLIKSNYKEIDGYISDRWINITKKAVNKGAGLKELLDILKIDDKDVSTIGDNINDLSMSDYNYNNFRMTNSVIELKGKTIRAYNSVYELIMDILKDGLH